MNSPYSLLLFYSLFFLSISTISNSQISNANVTIYNIELDTERCMITLSSLVKPEEVTELYLDPFSTYQFGCTEFAIDEETTNKYLISTCTPAGLTFIQSGYVYEGIILRSPHGKDEYSYQGVDPDTFQYPFYGNYLINETQTYPSQILDNNTKSFTIDTDYNYNCSFFIFLKDQDEKVETYVRIKSCSINDMVIKCEPNATELEKLPVNKKMDVYAKYKCSDEYRKVGIDVTNMIGLNDPNITIKQIIVEKECTPFPDNYPFIIIASFNNVHATLPEKTVSSIVFRDQEGDHTLKTICYFPEMEESKVDVKVQCKTTNVGKFNYEYELVKSSIPTKIGNTTVEIDKNFKADEFNILKELEFDDSKFKDVTIDKKKDKSPYKFDIFYSKGLNDATMPRAVYAEDILCDCQIENEYDLKCSIDSEYFVGGSGTSKYEINYFGCCTNIRTGRYLLVSSNYYIKPVLCLLSVIACLLLF